MTIIFSAMLFCVFQGVTLLMIWASSLPPSIFTYQNFLGSCAISVAISFLSYLSDPLSSSFFFPDPKFRCPLSILLFDLLSSLSRSHNSYRGNFDLFIKTFYSYDFWHHVVLWQLRLHFHRIFPQGKPSVSSHLICSKFYSSHSPKASILLEVPLYCLVF